MFVFAHLSDVHLDLGSRALGRTRRVMHYLRGLPIDAILVTGDIADHGDAAEYEQARDELSTPGVPVLILPGNHDDRSAFTKVLRDQETTGPVNLARRIGEVLFLLCDSSIPRHNEGLLEPETLAWIRARLAETEGPAFICLHHPPVELAIPLADSIRLESPAGLAAIVAEHPRVVAVLCGHAHTAAATTFAGRPLLLAPGVVSTARLPWTTAEEVTWANAADLDDTPAVAFHVLDDNHRLTTHFRNAPAATRE
jgi:3',5'-cyclic-AMP phosphodiesterase